MRGISVALRLNDDCIAAVVASNVARFREIPARDSLCPLADGRLINRNRPRRWSQGRVLSHARSRD